MKWKRGMVGFELPSPHGSINAAKKVTAVAFIRTGKQYELYSCSDDKKIWKWTAHDGSPVGELCALDVCSYV